MQIGEITAILKTREYRGDHSADVSISIVCDPAMTIGELTKEWLNIPTDVIELRRMQYSKKEMTEDSKI